jgi:hypothetical protein
MFSKAAWFSLAIGRWPSATKTTASAPASTTRRVALYCTCPGTVYSWILKSYPDTVPRLNGSRSKKSVRSWAVLSEISRFAPSGSLILWICSRFVVLPD